ncbi:flagellar hook-length control protein FliK [Parahaliea aestuarii]|uniref:Flagellar hook-length control protein-like C-terminal domain-containing protein n=1 Tax=Parahaliea aestuarii TaxID=1852021 RepID=A0A5C9A241_9GAMM|nr:flagellar hook-length control protein FliK [Parahaliea aestuarii]TXS94786.1 hypothetical protein FVW59_02425 [Parahaliea aestuarii]
MHSSQIPGSATGAASLLPVGATASREGKTASSDFAAMMAALLPQQGASVPDTSTGNGQTLPAATAQAVAGAAGDQQQQSEDDNSAELALAPQAFAAPLPATPVTAESVATPATVDRAAPVPAPVAAPSWAEPPAPVLQTGSAPQPWLDTAANRDTMTPASTVAGAAPVAQMPAAQRTAAAQPLPTTGTSEDTGDLLANNTASSQRQGITPAAVPADLATDTAGNAARQIELPTSSNTSDTEQPATDLLRYRSAESPAVDNVARPSPAADTSTAQALATGTSAVEQRNTSGAATPVSSGAATSSAQELTAPLATPAWRQQLEQQVSALHQRGLTQVELQLHPTELGPLAVSLKVDEQGAQAQFLSAHAGVRSAVEQAIPQLREALAQQGIVLAETSVGDQPGQGRDQAGSQSGRGPGSGRPEVAETGETEVTPSPAAAAALMRNGVDLYA